MRSGMSVARKVASDRERSFSTTDRPICRSSKPAVWVISWAIVIGCGYVSGILKEFRYELTSVLRSSRCCSASCITAVHVNSFVTEPMRNRVSDATTGRFSSMFAEP